MAEVDEELKVKQEAGIERNRHDPWAYAWVGNAIATILEMCGTYPEYFPAEEGIKIICEYSLATAPSVCFADPEKWERGLRQTVLNRLKTLCNSCTRCELAQNRLPGRGSSFGEGKVDADLMLVGEGPGSFEQATGGTFVDTMVVRASTCLTRCKNFEACYRDSNGKWARHLQRDCVYEPVKISEGQIADRIKGQGNGLLATTGQLLGTQMRKNKLYRQSFVQVLKMSEDAGLSEKGKFDVKSNVYLTNAVRCRCTKLDNYGRIRDEHPKAEHVAACNPWLEMTRLLVKPRRIVAVGNVGVTALHPELPKGWKITQACAATSDEPPAVRLANGKAAFVLLHPSYIQRMLDPSNGGSQQLYDTLLDKFSLTLAQAKETAETEKKEESERTEATHRTATSEVSE